jgi:hypothetical protein
MPLELSTAGCDNSSITSLREQRTRRSTDDDLAGCGCVDRERVMVKVYDFIRAHSKA